jgi:C1A family cysteine protease
MKPDLHILGKENAMKGMGWRPDLPDFRDYTPDHPKVKPMLAKVAVRKAPPASVDLRQWCSPVEDQGQLGSCTANAAAGMYEYFERKAFGRHADVSRLFIYKTTRDLMKVKGDTGAELRNTMGALVLFGAPPEEYWQYDIAKFDQEPPVFVYAFGQAFQALTYYRLDLPGTSPAALLSKIKAQAAAGLPSMFGFTCYSSLDGPEADKGKIPFPAAGEKVVGGHAVVVVGYDDAVKCKNASKGALLIRNSWGTSWGEHGYGYLPYDYVLKGLAEDFWVMIKAEWVDTKAFG